MTKWLNRLHMLVHFTFGVFIAAMVSRVTYMDFWTLLPFSVIGSFVPDLDHLLFFFTYGRRTKYALTVKTYLKKAQIKEAVHFCAYNHKQLNGLYSHTWYGVLMVMLGAILSFRYSTEVSVLFVGMSFHFVYDILEDLMMTGRVNSNWRGHVVKYDAVDEVKANR